MNYYFKHLATNLQTKQPVDLTMHIGDIEISQKTGKPYPKVRKDFRAEGLHKATFEKMYGKTDTLDIWFPSADLSKVASVFQEYRNDGGVPLAWVYSPLEAILDGEPQETYEIFVPSTQKRVFVDQPIFEKHIHDRKLTGRDTLRLFFWLKKFMTAGIFCTCQLETRGVESSIPGILKMLAMFAGIGKLQVPFQLTYKIQESKGVDKDGANQKRMFPVLSLHPDTTETGQQDMLTAAQRFLALAVAPEVMGTRAIQQTRPTAKALSSGQPEPEDPIDTMPAPVKLQDAPVVDTLVTPESTPASADNGAFPNHKKTELAKMMKDAGRFPEFLATQKQGDAAMWTLYHSVTQPQEEHSDTQDSPKTVFAADVMGEDDMITPFDDLLADIRECGTAADVEAAQAALTGDPDKIEDALQAILTKIKQS